MSNCDQSELDTFRYVFATFDRFLFRSEFRITNETLFLFLKNLSSAYHSDVPQNWNHAIETMRFLVTLVHAGRADSRLTRLDLFAMMVAALAHDVGHTGFRELDRASIPFSVLYRHQPVLEIQHCKILIQILARDECNLFRGLGRDDYRYVWELVIQLIHATNYCVHPVLLKEYERLVHDTPLDLEKPRHRLIIMKLLMKAADLSDLVKEGFEPPDSFFDEMFIEGQPSPVHGFVFNAVDEEEVVPPLFLNREKSKLAALTSLCQPVFSILLCAFGELQAVLAPVKANIKAFKQRVKAERMKEAIALQEQPRSRRENAEGPAPDGGEDKAVQSDKAGETPSAENNQNESSEVLEEPSAELIPVEKGYTGKIHSDSESGVSALDSTDSFVVEPRFARDEELADDERSEASEA
jgi:hypothetical protein